MMMKKQKKKDKNKTKNWVDDDDADERARRGRRSGNMCHDVFKVNRSMRSASEHFISSAERDLSITFMHVCWE